MNKSEQLDTVTPASVEKPNTVILHKPLKRGEATISEVTLREPSAGELRGLKLLDVLNLDVDTIAKLLPRISTPTLVQHEVLSLGMVDLHAVCEAVAGFFTPPEKKAD